MRPQASNSEVVVTTFLPEEDRRFLDQLDDKHLLFRERCEYVLNHSPATIKTYGIAYANFRRFLLDRSGGRDGRSLAARAHELDSWVLWNRKRGLSMITTNTYWRTLRPFFTHLEKTEGISNPYHGAKAPAFQAPLPKALKAAELLRVLDAARSYPWRSDYQRERTVALFGTMIYAGLRRSEVLKLHFADVNLEEGSLLVRRGKGRGGGRDRTGYICPELRTILQRYLRERQREGLTCPELFASRGNRGLSLEQFKRIFLLVRRASGVAALTPHCLRHSFITMLLRSGVPINVAQALAGHASITTTALYLRVWDEDKKAQINRLRLR